MTTLSGDQRKFYEEALPRIKHELAEIDQQIEAELAKVRDRLAELQNAKKASQQMYAAVCLRLGIENDLGVDEEEAANV